MAVPAIVPDTISTGQLADKSGVPIVTINNWFREGLLIPSIRPSRKQGSPAKWAPRDVDAVKRLAEVFRPRGDTIHREELRRAAPKIQRMRRGEILVVREGGFTLVSEGTPVKELCRQGPVLLVPAPGGL